MAKPKKPIRPLLEKCPQCLAEPGIKCTEQGFVLETVHVSRYSVASLRQTPAPDAPDISVLLVKCSRCGAMPRRICTGPPPMRDPKPYHKERWLEKFKLDNAMRKAMGIAPLEDPGRPWLDSREAPKHGNPKGGWRYKQESREQKEEMSQDDE